MTGFLLKLFGIASTGSAHFVSSELVFGGGVAPVWLLLMALVLTAAAVLMYRREEGLSLKKRILLTALRVAIFLLLVLLIARPVLRFTLEGDVRKALILLVDRSASMSIADPRTENDDLVRAAIAQGTLDPKTGLKQQITNNGDKPRSRFSIVDAAMANDRLDLVDRLKRDYDVRVVSFGEQLADVPVKPEQSVASAIGELKPDRPATALGDALRDAVGRSRGQPVAGVVLITDGAGNTGSSPLAAAELAGREKVPVYAWGVGVTNPKDVAVVSMTSRDLAFVDDEIPVTAKIRTSGLVGQTIKVVARLGEEVVGSQDVQIKADGETSAQLLVTPEKPGAFNLTVAVDPLASETIKDNNSQSQPLRVVDGKIKVLYIEQAPRWEFKYLEAMLVRDRRVQAKFVLLEGDKSLAEGRNSPYLPSVPTAKEELFKYDLILIGDVDPSAFSGGQLDAMEQFVNQFGGAVVTLAGRRFMPAKYLDTPLAKMLPVEFPTQSNGTAAKYDQPIKVELTPAGKESDITRLGDDEADSARTWAKLPPIYFAARVSRAKPAAEVLVVEAGGGSGARGKMPIIADQQYGLGQTMFIGTDNIWRWRKNVGDTLYVRLWGQIIQRLALPHLLGESRRTQLSADKKTYSVGERMTVYARLYDEKFNPISDPQVRGTLTKAGDATGTPVALRALPGQPGMYRAELTAPAPGQYSFSVEGDPKVTLDLPVVAPKLEFAETAMNEPLLKSICDSSRGEFFREEDLYKLPDSITQSVEKVRSNVDVEIWSNPVFLLLIVALAGTEWAVRKLSYLK